MSLTSHGCCARLKILEQAQIFSATHIITLSGLCIHRKAINRDKHPVLWMVSYYRQDFYMQGKMFFFLFIALERIVTFCKEGGGMFLVWALRARSYKTKAES